MCADIFGGVQPPAWLTELTRQRPGQLGHTIGLALGGGMLALQPNEDGDGLKGIQQGLYEARLNEQDPNWQVKTEALKSQVVGNWARAATEWQSLNTMKQDMADWMNHDLGALTKYSEELKTNPDATPPVVQSTKGHQALQQIETSRLRQSTLDVKRQMAKDLADYHEGQLENASTAAKQKLEDGKYFNKTLPTVKSPAERARIRELQEKGNTADAMAALEAAEKEAPASVQAAQIRADAAKKSPRETAAVQNIKQINDWEQQAKDAEAAGDLETAKDLRKNSTMLQEQLKGWGMTMGYDDQGRAIFSMGKGSQPTVGTQTMAQGKMLQYENAAQQIDYLQKNLTAAHVGVAGAAGELLIDKSMEQLFPGSENKGRVQVRSTMTYLRDGLMREMADDRSGRFSAADREEVGKALPSNGVFESEADAKDRLERVRQILASRTKVYAHSMNIPAPSWSLNEKDKDEIVRRYKDGVTSKLDPNSDEFKKKGFLSKDDAAEALQRSQ